MFVKNLTLLLLMVFFIGPKAIAQSKFSWGTMAHFGTGQTGNSTDVLSRGMSHFAISVLAGYNIKKFRVGLNYEYDMIGQTADPGDFSGQNIGGKSGAAGLRLEFYDGKQAFGIIYRVSDKLTLDKPTVAGTTSVYDAKSGYGIQYYRQLRKNIGFVIDYTSGEYKSAEAITADMQWSRVALGMVLTNFSGSK